MWTVISVLALAGACSAQVFSRGSCPEVKVVANFSVPQYLGAWYELYKFPVWFELNQKCVTANYTLLQNNHIRVDNTGISKSDGTLQESIGDAYAPDPSTPAKILVKFPSAPVAADYWVLDTDYKNYTLIYSCLDLLGVEKVEFAWILGRQRTLDSATTNKLLGILGGYKVDTGKLIKEDQTSCAA